MKPFLTFISIAALCLPLQSQNVCQEILQTVERQSPKLAALRLQCQAQQEEARQMTVLDDPEVSFAYLWGDPSAIGNRWDLSVSQSFDFPTAYLHRRKVKNLAIESAQLQYEAARVEVLQQARLLCVELAYNDSLFQLLKRQYHLCEQLLQSEHIRLEEGATTVLAYNQAQRQLLQSGTEMQQVEGCRRQQELELCALMGESGVILPLSISDLPIMEVPTVFEDWWAQVTERAPLMRYVQKEVERADEQVRLSKDGWLPGLRLGYMSENTREETFRGLTVGMTLPAWNNRHRVKASQLRSESAQMDALTQKQAFMARLESLFSRAWTQRRVVDSLRHLLDGQQTQMLLQRQFDEGAITRSDYLAGLIEHIELQKSLLSAEREERLMWSELRGIE